MKRRFWRQYYTGKKIGGILDTYQRSAALISAIQFLAMIIILYTTSARPFLDIYFPWMTFWMYMAIAVVFGIIIMTIVYIIAAPSAFGYFNQQLWEHDNPVRRKLEFMEETQKELSQQLDRIEEILKKFKGQKG